MSGFKVVHDQEIAPEAGDQDRQRATKLLMLGLATVSKRFAIAALNGFGLLSMASAWWLWMATPDPNTHQLVGLGLYGVLVLFANLIVRRA